ncbi:MAG: hypothetical protein QOF24_1894 [Verrucomicrobiota bacterium]|jgi:hypothetical protein
MMRNIFLILVFTAVAGTVTLLAAPTPTPSAPRNSTKNKTETRPASKNAPAVKLTPATPLIEGWSLVNGVWVHSDGYKYVNGQVIRTGNQTHKRVPKPPTKAQLDSVKRNAPPSAADAAKAKAVERERNLTPRPAPQTGTHL